MNEIIANSIIEGYADYAQSVGLESKIHNGTLWIGNNALLRYNAERDAWVVYNSNGFGYGRYTIVEMMEQVSAGINFYLENPPPPWKDAVEEDE